MSIYDETWDRPTCVYCHKEIPYGQHANHKDRLCVMMYVPQADPTPMNIPVSNGVDEEYFRLLNLILNEGRVKKNRTGIDTIGVFGAQAKFNVDMNAFPILTTKKIFFKAIVHELLWFIRGDTNIKYLVDNNVHIWDEWAYKRYVDTPDKQLEPDDWYHIYGDKHTGRRHTFDEFIKAIKELPSDHHVVKKWGELGEGTYGGMWRAFPFYTEGYFPDDKSLTFHYEAEGCVQMGGVDQLGKVIDKLKTNPDDRRMIVSAWHPYWVDHCALPPCHCLFHFNTEELTENERDAIATNEQRNKAVSVSIDEYDKTGTYFDELTKLGVPTRRLNVLLYQRSVDSGLGLPFNITSYSLLTAMVAHCVNMVPGVFTHTYGDLHIYQNHISTLKEQLKREPKKLPSLWLNPSVKNLFDFKYEDIALIDYDCHPTLKMDVAV